MPQTDWIQIDRIRTNKRKAVRDLSITDFVSAEMDSVRRQHKAVGGCAAAWKEAMPVELAARAILEGVVRGVLTVRVEDSATRFEIDRFLRSGGEAQLVRRCPIGVRRVKLVV